MYMSITTTTRRNVYHTNESYAAGLEHLCFPVPAKKKLLVISILLGESYIKLPFDSQNVT
jgi:hypothetical protein